MGAATQGYQTILATYLKPQRGRFLRLAIALLGGIGLQLLMILNQGKVVEYGDRAELARNPTSRFSSLLRVGTINGQT